MAKKKTPGGTAGRGGVNPAPTRDNQTVRIAAEQLTMVPIDDLIPYANNAKKHGVKQINQIRASLREFGFVTPVLIDFDNNIIAGHGRVEAARAEGMSEVPCVLVTNLTEAQRKAYILADNRLSETAAWDTELLKIELEGLEALNFDTGIAGFDTEAMEELGVEIGSVHTQAEAYEDDFDEDPPEETTVREGDIHIWYGNGKFHTSVWDVDKPRKCDLHPTMKPIALVENAILNSTTEGDLVLDGFGGSGTTLIACEQLGRTCYMMEIDPKYVQVIINRWEAMTGKKAVLLNDRAGG